MHSVRNLSDYIAALIRASGPLTVARYMSEALNHPKWGYYARRNPLGSSGDFITAPEISQMFGELVTAWLIDCWEKMGRPDPAIGGELGPGRGTFISDLWRVAQMVPRFSRAINLCLVETSPVLREQQRQKLELMGCSGEVTWVESFDEVPEMPMLLIANEFFDALPVHQYIRFRGNWRERLVDIDPKTDQGFCYILNSQITSIPSMGVDERCVVDALEVCPIGVLLARGIGERLRRFSGAALIIDYASAHPGLSFQAVRAHSSVNPLISPGESDLSCAVDFKVLGQAAGVAGARVHGPVPQGSFLRSLGIEQRTATLIKEANPEMACAVSQSKNRLIGPEFMGQLFNALAISSPDIPLVEGFDIK